MSEETRRQRGTSTSGNPYAPPLNYINVHGQQQQRSSPEHQQSQSYPVQEPPRFLYPENQAYDPTAVSSRIPAYGPPSSYWHGHGQYGAISPTRGSPHPRHIDHSTYQGAWPAITSPSNDPSYAPAVRRGSRELSSPYANPYVSTLRSDSGWKGSGSREQIYEESSHSSSPTFSSSPSSEATTTSPYSATSPNRRHASISGVPLGFEQILHPLPPPPAPLPASPPSRIAPGASRFRLHIRQQPIAARACGAGDKDRRPIDPPPILQMLPLDFDPNSESDMDMLRDPRFTVGCLLYSVTPSSSRTGSGNEAWEERVHSSRIVEPFRLNEPVNTGANPGGAPQGRSVQVLSGKLFASPFFVDEDPDPDTAPVYPTSSGTCRTPATPSQQPAAFFIFSDLSVRTAGLYRLKFRLMNWGSVEDTGESMPILTEVWSDPFRVHPAKDFPGMRESSRLTEQLKALGVVDLKTRNKGKGRGQGR